MSKHEKPMIEKYWAEVGGTIVYEFCMVNRTAINGVRYLDALILPNGETKIAKQSEVAIEGADVILVQAKNSRLGMYLMGQTLFSVELMRRFKPATIRSIALCRQDDAVLSPFFASFSEIEVVVQPLGSAPVDDEGEP